MRCLSLAAFVLVSACASDSLTPPTPPMTVATSTVPLASPLASTSASAPPGPAMLPPPATPRRPVIDEYPGGLKVTDDYRWLEDWSDPEVKAWSEAENVRTRAFFDAIPLRKQVKERVVGLLAQQSPDWDDLEHVRGMLFALKHQPPKQQAFLVVMKADSQAGERVLLDPNVLDATGRSAIDFYSPSPDGKLVAVSLSQGGSESGTVHVYEVATGKERPDVIPRVNGGTAGGSVAWVEGGAGFYYTRYPRAGERPAEDLDFYQQVYFHKLGTPEADDKYVVGKDFPRIAETALHASDDGKYVVASVQNGDGGEYVQLVLSSGKVTKLADLADKVVRAKFGPDGHLYLLSRAGAPHGKILRVSPASPVLSAAEVVVPEGEAVIQGFSLTGKHAYVVESHGGPQGIAIRPLSPGARKEPSAVPILPVSSVGQIVHTTGGTILFRNESYTTPPAWYTWDVDAGAVQKTSLAVTSPADFRDAEVTRDTCTSRDGTKVPMSIVAKKGIAADGTNPTILTGYGGFGISRTPVFRPQTRAWLDHGGVYAYTNLRGGGEMGEEWHLAGNLTHKQNVFDDFAACAALLIDKKITSPGKLAVLGGSNGGLLMGAMLTQHPTMVRAVVALVGIYDMLRVEHDSNGAFNVTEYGSTKNPAELAALFAYSPYHHVADGVRYPAVLFMTGANDPRVAPYHSRKMVARLQAASASGLPILLRTSGDTGHGIGSPLGAVINETTDIYSFLLEELGVAGRVGN